MSPLLIVFHIVDICVGETTHRVEAESLWNLDLQSAHFLVSELENKIAGPPGYLI